MPKNIPTIAIVGPANAGKSSLFNRLIGRKQAIVAREAGTTRDSVNGHLTLGDQNYLLIDTAGLKTAADEFEATIQDQIADAMSAADLILITLDATLIPSITEADLLRQARKSGKSIILVLNKSDLKTAQPVQEFAAFGVEPTIAISATTAQGVDQLKNAIIKLLPGATKSSAPDQDITIALVGRPNVGKSLLFNTLARKQQAIVADRAGTTRDLNHLSVNYHGQAIQIIDTAGVRKSGKQEVGIEKFSVVRTMQAINQADICLLLIDGTEPFNQLDQKLAGLIDEAGKGLIVVISKEDLIEDKESKDRLLNRLSRHLKFVPYAPAIFTSGVTGRNVAKIFDLVLQIKKQREQVIPTRQLNQLLNQAKRQHTPAGLKNSHPKLRYVVQTDTNPPWFVIYGSDLKHLHWSYKRYLETTWREQFDYTGTAIKFSFIDEHQPGYTKKRPKKENPR